MSHNHAHHKVNINNKFIYGIILNLAFIIVEVIYGLKSNSLALMADAAHNIGDILGLFIAWFGYWLSHKKAPMKFTYGYKKSTIIAAFINAVLLFIAVGGIIIEAVQRLGLNEPVMSNTVITVALIGAIVNGLTAYLFFQERHNDININGAFLHMIFDSLVSVGVIIAGLLIQWTLCFWLDPVISLIIAILILFSSWGLFKESLNLMLQAVPASVDIDKLKKMLFKSEGLISIHDLHIWPISTTEIALSAHIVVSQKKFNEPFLRDIEKIIKLHFPISHVTLQLENDDNNHICETDC